jgi:diketogulonate reductase-like aldo/keto reductase
VQTALSIGYRHIDAAACYDNEDEVGAGIKDSPVAREDIFVSLNEPAFTWIWLTNEDY